MTFHHGLFVPGLHLDVKPRRLALLLEAGEEAMGHETTFLLHVAQEVTPRRPGGRRSRGGVELRAKGLSVS